MIIIYAPVNLRNHTCRRFHSYMQTKVRFSTEILRSQKNKDERPKCLSPSAIEHLIVVVISQK